MKYRWLSIFAVWWTLALAATWWSYHFVDPNLTLISAEWYVNWQTTLWQSAGINASQLTWFYIFIVGIWWLAYAGMQYFVRLERWKEIPREIIFLLSGTAGILFLGYNALSHDIFNYLFNAKMIAVYQHNPHVSVALDFASDPWVRFMHNIHTPAPYGWMWTVISLIPYILSGGIFLVAYFGMKLFMVLGWIAYLASTWWLLGKMYPESKMLRWSLVAFHPLILIETLLVGHNDLWMMWPVLISLGWLCCRKSRVDIRYSLGAILLFVFSIGIKFSTLLLAPFIMWLLWPAKRQLLDRLKAFSHHHILVWNWLQRYRADMAGMLLFAPLLTSRAQQFHPWYLMWSLTFLPFGRSRLWRAVLLGLSISSLYRYVPLMFHGWEYTDEIQLQMRLITFSGALLGFATWLLLRQIHYWKK